MPAPAISPELALALLAGVFSLVGVLIGGWLTRATERQRWLRRNRSEAFANFLEMLGPALDDADKIWFDAAMKIGKWEPPQGNSPWRLDPVVQTADIFVRIERHGAVVRFYLAKSARQEFTVLLNSLRMLYTERIQSIGRGAQYADNDFSQQAPSILSDISDLLERAIDA